MSTPEKPPAGSTIVLDGKVQEGDFYQDLMDDWYIVDKDEAGQYVSDYAVVLRPPAPRPSDDSQDICTWPGCTNKGFCQSGNFGNQVVCKDHFMITNGTTESSERLMPRSIPGDLNEEAAFYQSGWQAGFEEGRKQPSERERELVDALELCELVISDLILAHFTDPFKDLVDDVARARSRLNKRILRDYLMEALEKARKAREREVTK